MTPRTKQPTDTLRRVFRGGSWNYSSASNVRAAYRGGNTPSVRSYIIGFRTVQSGARQPLKGLTPP